MVTLSWSLLLALDQSLTPQILPHATQSTGGPEDQTKSALIGSRGNQEAKHSPVPSGKQQVPSPDHASQSDDGLTHFSDGLDEDVYWHEDLA